MDEGIEWAFAAEGGEAVIARMATCGHCLRFPEGVVFFNVNKPAKQAGMHLLLDPAYRGSGAGIRLAREGIKEAWRIGMQKISMPILDGNPFYKSPEKAMAHIGAVLEGVLKRHYWFKGKIRDIMYFAIYKEGSV